MLLLEIFVNVNTTLKYRLTKLDMVQFICTLVEYFELININTITYKIL